MAVQGNELRVCHDQKELQRSSLSEWDIRKRHKEIRQEYQIYVENRAEISKRMEKYKAYKTCLVPPKLEA
jgi:hypothetical protein